MDDKQFSRIESKLDLIISLLAKIVIQDKSKTEAIELLDEIGFENKHIAQLVGSTAKSVSVRKAEKKQREVK